MRRKSDELTSYLALEVRRRFDWLAHISFGLERNKTELRDLHNALIASAEPSQSNFC